MKKYLGNGQGVGVLLQLLGKFLVLGLKGLAVAAPGGISLQKDILCGIQHHILEVLAHNNHRFSFGLGFGDGLRLDVGLQLVGQERLEVSLERVTREQVASRVLTSLLDIVDHERVFTLGKAKVIDLLLVLGLRGNSKDELVLVLLSNLMPG